MKKLFSYFCILIIFLHKVICDDLLEEVLDIKVYDSTLRKYKEQYNPNLKVPKKLILNHRTVDLPEYLRLFAMRWITLNPEYEIILFNDQKMFQYLEDNLIDPEMKELLSAYPVNGMKADFFRFFFLYKEGGIYVDVDCEPYVPIREWPLYPFDDNQILIQSTIFYDQGQMHFLFAPPGHPFIWHVLKTQLQQWKDTNKQIQRSKKVFGQLPFSVQGDVVLWYTGPHQYVRAVLTFFGLDFKVNQKNDMMKVYEEFKKNNPRVKKIAEIFRINLKDNEEYNKGDKLFKHYFASGGKLLKYQTYITWSDQIGQNKQIAQINQEKEKELEHYDSLIEYFIDKEIIFVDYLVQIYLEKKEQLKDNQQTKKEYKFNLNILEDNEELQRQILEGLKKKLENTENQLANCLDKEIKIFEKEKEEIYLKDKKMINKQINFFREEEYLQIEKERNLKEMKYQKNLTTEFKKFQKEMLEKEKQQKQFELYQVEKKKQREIQFEKYYQQTQDQIDLQNQIKAQQQECLSKSKKFETIISMNQEISYQIYLAFTLTLLIISLAVGLQIINKKKSTYLQL